MHFFLLPPLLNYKQVPIGKLTYQHLLTEEVMTTLTGCAVYLVVALLQTGRVLENV